MCPVGHYRLHNTIDTVREIHETIGAAEALGRYDAWGFLCASVDSRSETAKLTSYSANGLPAIRLGSTIHKRGDQRGLFETRCGVASSGGLYRTSQ